MNSAKSRGNNDAAVYAAMLQAGFTRTPKADPADQARRFAIERLTVQRRYCDAFALWQTCKRSACRRYLRCRGDANACLQGALDRVPRDVQRQARHAIIAAMPPNLGAPEREARLSMPQDFYDKHRKPQAR
jgi:hypothetical protein